MIPFGSCRLTALAVFALTICLTVAPGIRSIAERIHADVAVLPIGGQQSPSAPGNPGNSGGGLERWCELPGSETNKKRPAAPMGGSFALSAVDEAGSNRVHARVSAVVSLRRTIDAANPPTQRLWLRI